VRISALLVLAPFAALLTATAARPSSETPPASAAAFETTIQPFLENHCYDCHDARHKKGDLNLEQFDSADAVVAHPDTWDEVLLKLRTGEMPPEDEIRPEPADLARVTTWIADRIAEADSRAVPDPGRVIVRRLNRAEYNNTVRDLVGVDAKPADDFPQDDTGYGFDTIGSVLSVPPVLMEKYLASAERIARTAIFGPGVMKPTLVRLSARSRKIQPSPKVETEYDSTGLTLPNALHGMHRIPVDADYFIRAVAGGSRPAGSEPIRLALWIDGTRVQTTTLDPEGSASFFDDDQQDFSGQDVKFRVRLTAGEHWFAVTIPQLYEGLPPSYQGPAPSSRPEPPPPVFKPRPDKTPEENEKRRLRFEEEHKERPPANNVRVSYIEVGGPYKQMIAPPAESTKRIFICGHRPGHHVASCAARILTSLTRRAFRRPVTPAEVSRYTALVKAARREGESFEQGIALALQGILVSPDFLFRLEGTAPTRDGAPALLNDHELATRLSYFLWASMPDARLRRLASAGQLRTPGGLEGEIHRMLADPKAQALVEQFGGQWLQTRALESARPDPDRFPDFEDYLRLSMQRETELFFNSVMREDRSILDFLTARDSFLNERLARHYGIGGVTGPEFRRVDLSNTPRSGVLMQGSVLTVSSYATRTSPVLRGKWILDNLFAAAPPPPPNNVERLNEEGVGTTVSLRERMEVHRRKPTCASCHRRMDPLGFGLENFDGVGAWRMKDGNFDVDSSGQLPDGRTFHGPNELAVILNNEKEAFARALTSKLLVYALGRGPEPADKRTVRTIARHLAAEDYRFSRLILEIVQSVPFQMRPGVAPQ
jgi:Protein of unknown function (DUF1592)/Protein of unknown function (DUF1588)/Protein of unknown function (DUF1587)/Protein of unknown function (DUF1585)/Protein of unknown function (DUF1595)/Planctomycete cytochrome C